MSEPDKKETTSVFNKNVSRRDVLKAAGIGGVGVLIGASGIGGALALADVLPTSQKKKIQMRLFRFTENIRQALQLKCKTTFILLLLT